MVDPIREARRRLADENKRHAAESVAILDLLAEAAATPPASAKRDAVWDHMRRYVRGDRAYYDGIVYECIAPLGLRCDNPPVEHARHWRAAEARDE